MPNPTGDQRAQQLETKGKQASPNSMHRPASDSQQTGSIERDNLGATSDIIFGVVIDAYAHVNSYIVQFEKGHSAKEATLLSPTPASPVGCSSITNIQPGMGVWCIVHKHLTSAIILGVEPGFLADGRLGRSDVISQASRSGLHVDQMHKEFINAARNGGIVDHSLGRPFDGVMSGEFGAMAETGTRVFADSFQAQVAVDESCGVWAFYHDLLCRLAGLNVQIRSLGHETELLDDQGETWVMKQSAPFFWEALGAKEFKPDPLREIDADTMQNQKQELGAMEGVIESPDDQLAFYRTRTFEGYLGQGLHEYIGVGPKELSGHYRYSEDEKWFTMFERFVSLTGTSLMRSGKGIIFTKKLLGTSPKPFHRPEDPNGDNDKDYRASSVNGGGEDHKVFGMMDITGDDKSLVSACGVLDQMAYLVNWESLHPFHYHKKDWKLPQESELDHADTDFAPIKFDALEGDAYLQPPETEKIKVDHRYGDVEYYKNQSIIGMLDTGEIVIGDGYGAEIRMAGGNMQISCPGDLWLQPGRNLNAFMGFDGIFRAQNSIDLTTTKKDVRIKAQKNLQILAGNDEGDPSGQGGILIESRSRSPNFDFDKCGEEAQHSGIMLRAPKSQVINYGKDIYLRTGSRTSNKDSIEKGRIVIDASRGDTDIIANCSKFELFAKNSAGFFIKEGDEDVKAVFKVEKFKTTLGGQDSQDNYKLCVSGPGVFKGGPSRFRRGITIDQGHIQTDRNDEHVGNLEGTGKQSHNRAMDQCTEDIQKAEQTAEDDTLKGTLKNDWYDDKKPGNDELMQSALVSLRTPENYKTKDSFSLFECRWQQLGRLMNTADKKWKEIKVRCGGDPEETYPYPGKEPLTEDQEFYQQKLTMYDVGDEKSHSKDRPEQGKTAPPTAYQNHVLRTEEPKVLNDEYLVIREVS